MGSSKNVVPHSRMTTQDQRHGQVGKRSYYIVFSSYIKFVDI